MLDSMMLCLPLMEGLSGGCDKRGKKCHKTDWQKRKHLIGASVASGEMDREDEEMGRGRLCWTKKISVNEWCLVSSVCVYGGQKQWGRERQAMLVMVVCMNVNIPYEGILKRIGRNLICCSASTEACLYDFCFLGTLLTYFSPIYWYFN